MLGGSGFTGRRVSALLAGAGVAGLARSAQAAAVLRSCGVEPIGGNLDDDRSIDEVFAATRLDTLVCVASLGFGHEIGRAHV